MGDPMNDTTTFREEIKIIWNEIYDAQSNE